MGEYRGRGENTKSYTEDERIAALELAATVGIRPAARHFGIAPQTFYKWAEKYPKVWSELRAGNPDAHKRRIAQNLEDLAERYADAENQLLAAIESGQIKAKDPKEAAALIKAMGSSRQAAIAGSRTISNEPERVEHTIDFPALEQAMARILDGAPEPEALPVANLAEADGPAV